MLAWTWHSILGFDRDVWIRILYIKMTIWTQRFVGDSGPKGVITLFFAIVQVETTGTYCLFDLDPCLLLFQGSVA